LSDVAVQQPARKERGPIITFSGMEGSGKTDLAKATAGEFRRKGYPVRMIKVYPLSLRNVTVSLFRPDWGESQVSTENYSGPLVATWKRMLFRICILLLTPYMRILSNRGTAVVFDRYLYDSLVELYENGACGKRFFSRYARFLPSPDVAFLLRTKESRVNAGGGAAGSGRPQAQWDAYIMLTDFGDFWILDTDSTEQARMEAAGIISHECWM